MAGENSKKIILTLRWTLIIITSYLVLFGTGWHGVLYWGHALILFYICTNIALSFAARKWFSDLRMFYTLVIFDTVAVTVAMYLAQKAATDFYMVFFLIIIFASLSRSYKLLISISGATALIYGFLLYTWGVWESDESISYSLRIPFILIVAAFYGYIVLAFAREKQKELEISEGRFGSLFHNANDGILILKTPRMVITDVNRKVEELTEFEKSDLVERPVVELFDPGDKQKALAFFDCVAAQGEGRTDLLSLRRKDEIRLEVDFSIKRVNIGDESFFQANFRDLTEQRVLEKKIQMAKRNLESVFDGIRDRLSVQSPDFQIMRVNRAVSEKYHLDFRELIGRKCYEIYFHRGEPCNPCPVMTTIHTKQFASTIMKVPEEESTLRIYSYPILNESGNVFSVIEHIQDITEERRLQEQLVQSEKLAGIGYLASGVAHEINNPLSGIIGMTEAAQEEKDVSTVRTYLEDILACSHRIREIVFGLRSYSRVAKEGDQTLIDLNEVMENSLKMVRMGFKSGDVEVIKEFQPIEKVKANPGEVQQVFINLLTNAFQSIDGKGGKIVLSTRSFKDAVEAGVSDSGMGIPEKYLGKVFDPFFTTKKTGEGTGLGLNIVYRIVTKYGGTVDVESKEGKGATFTVRFPLRRVEHDEEDTGRRR